MLLSIICGPPTHHLFGSVAELELYFEPAFEMVQLNHHFSAAIVGGPFGQVINFAILFQFVSNAMLKTSSLIIHCNAWCVGGEPLQGTGEMFAESRRQSDGWDEEHRDVAHDCTQRICECGEACSSVGETS